MLQAGRYECTKDNKTLFFFFSYFSSCPLS